LFVQINGKSVSINIIANKAKHLKETITFIFSSNLQTSKFIRLLKIAQTIALQYQSIA